jgi:hypothetical protein
MADFQTPRNIGEFLSAISKNKHFPLQDGAPQVISYFETPSQYNYVRIIHYCYNIVMFTNLDNKLGIT